MNNKDLKKNNFHILIIDDDEKIRLLLKQFLENNEFRVSDVENTDQAKNIMEDYMTKPFEPRELLLRIQYVLKRFTNNLKSSENQGNTRFGPFSFNHKSLNLYKNNISVHLTTSEQKLLNCFCKSPNIAFSRDDINNSLGGNMETRSIDVAIARIRRKIEIDQRYPVYLQTVRGIGWMLQTHEEENND